MKNVIVVFLVLMTLQVSAQGKKWVELFDGKSLDNWKINESPASFRVENGSIIIEGPRGHLFYDGPVGDHNFKDFEVQATVMTFPGANSGLYVCTDFLNVGFPSVGYEVQVNNSHTDWRRTASLYNIVDTSERFVKDEEWFDLNVTVKGNRIVTKINGVTVVDYTQPENPLRSKGQEQRLIKSGTIALQAHDPKSKVAYKSIKVRSL